MKINKDTGISIGALAIILPVAFWIFTSKANKEDVKEAEKKITYEREINIKQTVILDNLLKKVDKQEEDTKKEIERLYKRIEK